MNLLSVKYKNILFENPFLLASAPPTRNAEMIMRAFKQGWAGAVTKTICLKPETIINTSPRLYGFKAASALSGLNNIELISERSPQDWVEDIKQIKDNYPEKILIASIMSEAFNKNGWQELANLMTNAGADIIELNVSCPHGMPERGMGSFCSDVPSISADIIRWTKEVTNLPVWTKLSPGVPDIAYLAEACLEGGSDGIVATNTLKSFAGINIETLNPNLNVQGKTTYGGASGKILKPVAQRAVSDIAAKNKCYISASGGISNWQDGVEFMLLGASTLQICTEVMFRGFGIIHGLKTGLEEYLERHGYSSAQELVGKAVNKITDFEELDKGNRLVAAINQQECISCGRCFVSCNDGGYQAVEPDEGYKINPEKCTGCGLCSIVCPKECINFHQTKIPLMARL